MPAERVTARVHGRVQGVGFRIYVKSTADRLGVVGTVRNLPGGAVETVGEGRSATLDRFVDALREGSPAARVERVEVLGREVLGPRVTQRRFEIER